MTSRRAVVGAALAVLIFANSKNVTAAPQQAPEARLLMNNLSVLRLNPLGLEDQLRVGYQRRLYDSESAVSRDNFLFVGVYPKLNPAFAKLGPMVEIQPLSIFNLRAQAEYVGFFSTFGFLQSFQSPGADYSDSTLLEGRNRGDAYAASGLHTSVEPLVQLKVGPLVVRNRFMLEYWRMNIRSGDTVFYEATLDTLVPRRGFVLANDADVLVMAKSGLVAGARYSSVLPRYGDEVFQPGDNREVARKNGHHRLGALFAYTFFDEGFTSFNKPSVIVITSWYLSHRFRTGQDVSRAFPYVILGFAFQSDLLGSAPL